MRNCSVGPLNCPLKYLFGIHEIAWCLWKSIGAVAGLMHVLFLQARPYIACSTFFRGFLPSSTNSWRAICQLLAKKALLMPRLHLPRSSYDFFVYDFLYDFFGVVGGCKLRRMCLHFLRSPYDFFRRLTRTKPYRDLADIVRQPQGYRTIIVLPSRPPYINRTMSLRWPCGSRNESVRPLCNCRVIICMYLNGYPCSFLHSIWTVFQSHVITNRAMKRLVFLVEHGHKVWNSVIRLCIF